MRARQLFLVMVMACGVTAARAEDCPVFLVVQDSHGLRAERVSVAAGEERSFTAGGPEGLVEVILPVGPGGSASDARAGATHVVRCAGDAIQRVIRQAGGKDVELPSRRLDDLRRYDIRVSVTMADGQRAAFLVEGYDQVTPEPGPVENPFAGIPIPLEDGDGIVFTDTVAQVTGTPVRGMLSVELDRHPFARAQGPDGREGWFIVDIGAAETVVARSFLPAEAEVTRSEMVEYSSAGRRVLDYTPGGATGAVLGVLGHATLDRLRFGDLVFDDVRAAVLDEIPDLFNRPVAGILGLDLLRRAGRVVLDFPAGGRGTGRIELLPATEEAAGSSSLPFTLLRSHVVVTADVNDTDVHFILDTGAPVPMLAPEAARAADVPAERDDERTARGLDSGAPVPLASGRIARFGVGEQTVRDLPVKVAPLEVFKTLQAQGQSIGLLGNTFFALFDRVDIDLTRRRVTFIESPSRPKEEPGGKEGTDPGAAALP